MTDTKHTPGPWFFHCEGGRYIIEHKPEGPGIAALAVTAGKYPMSAENARLIAAAPELLEALKEAHEALDILAAKLITADETFYLSKSGKPWEAMKKANAAIRKATHP